jgi:uncharacterized Zn-binding protein involved in type VI secretion
MGKPAAKQGDRITASDKHLANVSGTPTIKVTAHDFDGRLNGNLSHNVNINGMPAALAGSTANNQKRHIPEPATLFVRQPRELATISRIQGRAVRINGRAAACHGDAAETCNDPIDLPSGKVLASANVNIGSNHG